MTRDQRPLQVDPDPRVNNLLASLKREAPHLTQALASCNDHWVYEDFIYRFYHQSFKVYGLQDVTSTIVDSLEHVLPDRPLNDWFMRIVREGTGLAFEPEHNQRWLESTRPILEAFFHARFFLEQAVHYGSVLDVPPLSMPSGWAALLYLYNLR